MQKLVMQVCEIVRRGYIRDHNVLYSHLRGPHLEIIIDEDSCCAIPVQSVARRRFVARDVGLHKLSMIKHGLDHHHHYHHHYKYTDTL